MSLLFNTLSRFVIAFLPISKCLLILWLQSPFTVVLEPLPQIKSVTPSTFSSSICHEVMGLDAMILSFKPAFSLSSFTSSSLHSSFSFSGIRVVSSAYLKFFIFLPAILIPVYDSWQIEVGGGGMEAVTGFLFLGSKITRDCSHEIKMLAPWKESYDSRLIKKQRHHSADKSLYSQSYDFHSSHVQM